MATANVYFSGKKYTYEFKKPDVNTDSAISMAIAQSMWEKEHHRNLTKFSGAPQHYNLLMEIMSHRRNVYTSEKGSIDYFQEASRRTNEGTHVFDESTQKWKVLVWRVGRTFSNRLVIDIDDKSVENLRFVCRCYEIILQTKFKAIETNGGYWLIAENKCDTKKDFVYQHCKVLNPSITRNEVCSFVEQLYEIDYDIDGNFVKASSERIFSIPGVNPRGNIDIRFNFLSIKREQSTLRISQKQKDEKIVEVSV